MLLRIDQDTSIKEVQKQFNAWYPFLQIHFFKNWSTDNKLSKKAERALPEWPISNLKNFKNPEYLPIDDKITVAELLKSFSDIGLLAQVCRKSGNHWVETSLTSDWTLARQNEEAMLISVPESDLHLYKLKGD
jgi:hypothetical protein